MFSRTIVKKDGIAVLFCVGAICTKNGAMICVSLISTIPIDDGGIMG